MTYYAFIVGVNQEWPEQRTLLGDIGLARTLVRHCGLPRNNLAEVYDHHATRSNSLRVLERLLDRRNDEAVGNGRGGDDVLLFYYGGHGKREHFCTQRQCVRDGRICHEPWLRHAEVIDLFERKFKGGTVVSLIDCCHSGGFGEAVVRKRSESTLSVNYACVLSSAPGDLAGMEWTISECFIRAFKGELLCAPHGASSDRNQRCYYLYAEQTKDKWAAPTESSDASIAAKKKGWTHPTWGQVVDFFVNEMGRIKGGWAQTFFSGKRIDDEVSFLHRPCCFGDNIEDTSFDVTSIIPRDEAWMDRFRGRAHAVNNWVYVKPEPHCGWHAGQIVSINHGSGTNASITSDKSNGSTNISTANIRLHHAITKEECVVTTTLDSSAPGKELIVLGGRPFAYGFEFEPKHVTRVMTAMFRSLAFYDVTVPPNTKVRVKWEDGKNYNARTLHRADIPWGRVELDSSPSMIGPCAPLLWEDDGSVSFVPTEACIVNDSESRLRCGHNSRLSEASSISITGDSIITAFDAMMASLSLEGKTLHGNGPILNGLDNEGDSEFWEAYDPEDGKFSRVQLMNKVDASLLPLNVFAHHLCYRESGSYIVVYWESESMLALVPTSYLRRRNENSDGDSASSDDESNSDSSDDESDSYWGDKESDTEEIRRYVEEACKIMN